MTTIAFRSGILAADTQISYQTFTNGMSNKITQLSDDLAVAMAGPARLRIAFEKWVKGGAIRDALESCLKDAPIAALVVHKTRLYEFEDGFLVPVHADYAAVGSGAHFAMGAMAHGASAEEAVEAASAHDKATGGPVTTLTLF